MPTGSRNGATFVRELVAAARSLETRAKLPDAGAYPRAWTNMLGVPLLEGILAFGLVDVADAVLRLARPIVTIATEPAKDSLISVGDSKFGGRPDLPAGVDWPTCERGATRVPGADCPGGLERNTSRALAARGGLLSFFAYQSHESGYQPGVAPRSLRPASLPRLLPGAINLHRPAPPCISVKPDLQTRRSVSLS